MSDVTDTIDQLRAGQVSLDVAAAKFRGRQWPMRPAAEDPAADTDPEPEPDGGFGEVEAAYTAGLITDSQYTVLAHAAAESMSQAAGPGSQDADGDGDASADTDGDTAADAALVKVLADHEERVTSGGLPRHALPGARAVLVVYGRGVQAWPGETKTRLSPQQWALGRVGAFLDLAAGDPIEGYERDKDQLPDGHPDRPAG